MPAYEPNLPARQVHERFTRTLEEAESVRKNLVLWFADLYRRKLYLELGYTSVYAYTAERHGFSRSRCTQFIRLAESLSRLPALRASLAAGEMPWTKAREVVKVATPRTEQAWVKEAQRSSRRTLEKRVAAARGRAKEERGSARDQGRLSLTSSSAMTGGVAGRRDTHDRTGDRRGGPDRGPDSGVPAALAREIPEEVRLRFSALRYAEYGALVEKLRKLGWREPVEDLIVAGLAALAAEGRTSARKGAAPGIGHDSAPSSALESPADAGGIDRAQGAAPGTLDGAGGIDRAQRAAPGTLDGAGGRPAGAAGPAEVHPRVIAGKESFDAAGVAEVRTRVFTDAPYQVVIRRCETCGKGEVLTGRGPRSLPPAELRAVLCDARVHRPGERNQAAIPPARRREVLERDGHRCRVPGCGSTHFLSVHHIEPRSAGGSNAPENLVTLCASCHRAIHEMAERDGREILQRFARERDRANGARRPGTRVSVARRFEAGSRISLEEEDRVSLQAEPRT
jgi:hypothetical protein